MLGLVGGNGNRLFGRVTRSGGLAVRPSLAGAAAESVLLAVATAKMVADEGKVLNEYRRAHGRKKITDRITGGLQQGLAEQFVTASGILSFWRDEAAHGTRTTITAVEAQASLAQLLRFAQLTADNWDTLTRSVAG